MDMPMLFRTLAVVLALFTLSQGAPASAADLENTIYLDLASGRVVIEMRPDLAPETCKRVKELVRRGFYDGLTFHRVIKGFMAQTGDPLGDGTGGTGHKLKGEFSAEPFVRGVVGMARGDDPDSGDSQFYIMTGPKPSLDHLYTVWGKVVSGMDYVDQIKAGAEEQDGAVADPDRIVRMQMAADVEKGKS
jgi:peptidylprolyl isomerase